MNHQTTVWFNTHSAVIGKLVGDADQNNEFRVVCTAKNSEKHSTAVFEREPRGLSDEEHLQYRLDFARRNSVNLFVPGRKFRTMAYYKDRFTAQGVHVMLAGDLQTLEDVDMKAACYRRLGNDICPIPVQTVVHDMDAFDAVVEDLISRFGVACFKPEVGIFGFGFRVVVDNKRAIEGLPSESPLVVTRQEARDYLAQKEYLQKGLMVMQYLEGTERSIDCLAQHGKLVRAIIRAKEPVFDEVTYVENIQLIEHNPLVQEYVRQITERLGLHGLYNVQFKDSGDKHYLLEINPRMSGGIGMACLSGVVLPYWGLRLETGSATVDDVPVAQEDFRVKQVDEESFVL